MTFWQKRRKFPPPKFQKEKSPFEEGKFQIARFGLFAAAAAKIREQNQEQKCVAVDVDSAFEATKTAVLQEQKQEDERAAVISAATIFPYVATI